MLQYQLCLDLEKLEKLVTIHVNSIEPARNSIPETSRFPSFIHDSFFNIDDHHHLRTNQPRKGPRGRGYKRRSDLWQIEYLEIKT